MPGGWGRSLRLRVGRGSGGGGGEWLKFWWGREGRPSQSLLNPCLREILPLGLTVLTACLLGPRGYCGVPFSIDRRVQALGGSQSDPQAG